MKSTAIYVLLEFICGLGFALLGTYIFSLFDNGSLMTSVFYTFVFAFVSMVFGVGLAGLFLFIILYLLIDALTSKLIPYFLSSVVLPLLIPLSGAVIGFNFKIPKP